MCYQIMETVLGSPRSAFQEQLSLEAFLWDDGNLYCSPVLKAKSVGYLNPEGQKGTSMRSFKCTLERQTNGERTEEWRDQA